MFGYISGKILIHNLPVTDNSLWPLIRYTKLVFFFIIIFPGKKKEERHLICNLNLFTLNFQTHNFFILSRKAPYESCAFIAVKQIPSLSL